MIALSRIKHGDKEGKQVVFEPGDEVKGLPKEVTDSLKKSNLIASKERAALLRPELVRRGKLKVSVETEKEAEAAQESDSPTQESGTSKGQEK